MALEELLGGVLSFTSLFTAGQPRFNQHDCQLQNSVSGNTAHLINACKVVKKDGHGQGSSQLEPLIPSRNVHETYGSFKNNEPINNSWTRSFCRSLSASVTIQMAIVPLGVLIAAALYLNLNTTDLCFERMRRDSTLPQDLMKWRLIGDSLETIAIHLWFPFTLAVLFGWRDFKNDYFSTFYISLVFGCIVVAFKIFLYFFHLYQTKQYFIYFGNFMFLLELIICSNLVGRKTIAKHPTVALSKFQISTIVSMQFITGFVIAMAYMYVIVASFNRIKNDIMRAMVALITPIFAVIPKALCKQLALRSSEFADKRGSFVLVYYLCGVVTITYRTMQADVKSTWIFIGISVLHGILHVSKKAAKKYIEKFWSFLIYVFRRLFCDQRGVRRSFNDTPHELRLHADLDIQNMLYEYTSIILIQIYFALYLITNFEVTSWTVIKSALLRIAIGVGIEVFFNCLAIFIQMHWNGIPVARIWFKRWRLHMLANAFLAAMTVLYFSPVLLEIVEVRMNSHQTMNMTNCTQPFQKVQHFFNKL